MTTHLLAVHDLSKEAILAIFKEAAELKAMRRRVLSAQPEGGASAKLPSDTPNRVPLGKSVRLRVLAPAHL